MPIFSHLPQLCHKVNHHSSQRNSNERLESKMLVCDFPHPSPWLVLFSPCGWATQYRAFSRRCSLKAWVTWARGSTVRASTNDNYEKYNMSVCACTNTGPTLQVTMFKRIHHSQLAIIQNSNSLSTLTSIASLTVDAIFWGAANGPISVHKEAMTKWVTEPLHSRRHTATR